MRTLKLTKQERAFSIHCLYQVGIDCEIALLKGEQTVPREMRPLVEMLGLDLKITDKQRECLQEEIARVGKLIESILVDGTLTHDDVVWYLDRVENAREDLLRKKADYEKRGLNPSSLVQVQLDLLKKFEEFV